MKAAAGLLVFALTGVQGKGNGVPSRTYGKPNSPSNAYKYAGAAAVGVVAGGAVGYYVGSRRYSPSYRGYNDYDDYDDYDDQNSRQNPQYAASHKSRRPTNCPKPTRDADLIPQPEYTKAFVWVQVALGIPRTELKAIELETDLFRDLMWRSPCTRPTQVLISYICSLDSKRKIQTAEMDRPSICTYSGAVESTVHSDARRKLSQTPANQVTMVEIAVGVRNRGDYNNMLEAVKEALDEPSGAIKEAYKTAATLSASSVVFSEQSTTGADGGSAGTAGTLHALIMGAIFAVFSVL